MAPSFWQIAIIVLIHGVSEISLHFLTSKSLNLLLLNSLFINMYLIYDDPNEESRKRRAPHISFLHV